MEGKILDPTQLIVYKYLSALFSRLFSILSGTNFLIVIRLTFDIILFKV